MTNLSPDIPSLIAKIYTILGGGTSSIPEAVIEQWVQYIEWTALALSLIFFIMFVRYMFLCMEVGREMGKKRLAAEMAQLAEVQKAAGKNARWLNVEKLANSTSESDWRRAIIEADSMLAELLTSLGYSGKDIGEQLRGATKTNFGTLDLAWEAHRMRNKIAHEGEALQITERDAQATIDMYRRVFEDLGYL